MFFSLLLPFIFVIAILFTLRKSIINYYKFLTGKIKFKELHLEDDENQRTLYIIIMGILAICAGILALIKEFQ